MLSIYPVKFEIILYFYPLAYIFEDAAIGKTGVRNPQLFEMGEDLNRGMIYWADQWDADWIIGSKDSG